MLSLIAQYAYVGLEGAKQWAQEWTLARQDQHPSLNESTLGVVVLENHVLLKALHGVELTSTLELHQ